MAMATLLYYLFSYNVWLVTFSAWILIICEWRNCTTCNSCFLLSLTDANKQNAAYLLKKYQTRIFINCISECFICIFNYLWLCSYRKLVNSPLESVECLLTLERFIYLVVDYLLSGSGNVLSFPTQTDDWRWALRFQNYKESFLSCRCYDKEFHLPPNEPIPFLCQVKPEKKHKANYSESCCTEDYCNEHSELSLNETRIHNLSLLPDEPGKDKSFKLNGEAEKSLHQSFHVMFKLLVSWAMKQFLFISSNSWKFGGIKIFSYVIVSSTLTEIKKQIIFFSGWRPIR